MISVVVATRNRHTLLERTLDALVQQRCAREAYEVIVADNGSSDRTRTVIEEIARRAGGDRIRYLYVEEPGKSRAVNAALRLVSGDIVAFTDDDVRPDPGWIAQLIDTFSDPAVDFVAGRILADWEAPPPRWMSPSLFGVLAIPDGGTRRLPIARGLNEHIMPIGANMAVRSTVIERLGGLRLDLGKLEGTLRTGEDHEFFLRLLHDGRRGAYEPEAVVHHFVPGSRLRRDYFRRWLFQNGRDVARLERQYPPAARRLLAVPGYLWRDIAAAAAAGLRAATIGDAPQRFASSVRVLWFAGYAWETWSGRMRAS